MRIAILSTAALLFSLVLFSCKKDNPVVPPVEPPVVLKDTVTISVKGVTYRSIELNVQCSMNNSQYSIRLFRTLNSKDTLVAEYLITVRDTTIIDNNNGNGLQLNTEYSYFAVTKDTTGEIKDTSNTVNATTLAATSHNYTWQEFNIGDWQSTLYDVWGTDENDVWAVGIVYIDNKFYGGLHYNGTDWNPDSTFGGYAIYGFASNDIWVVGGGIFHFNGSFWDGIEERYPILNDNAPYTSLWGTSSNDMYFCNQWGKIIHWNGTKAEIIYDTGGYYITDIYGTGPDNIWVCGARSSSNWENLLLHFDGYSWIKDNTLPVQIFQAGGILSFNPRENFIAGNGIFQGYTDNWTHIPANINQSVSCIRGDKSNNIFASGAFSFIIHFNGVDWHIYTELSTPSGGALYGIIPLGNKVFAVGYNENGSAAKIIIGTKN
jgi:hypothetical protein